MEIFTFKRAALLGSPGIAASQFYLTHTGNALSMLFVAICLAIEDFIKSPSSAYRKYIGLLGGFIVNASKTARRLVFVIAIGGTILAVDQTYSISFITWFEPLDDVVKRASVVLVVSTILVFYGTVVGAYISRIAIPRRDLELRRLELHFYLSIVVLILAAGLLILGSEVERHLTFSGKDPQNMSLALWPEGMRDFLEMLTASASVWVVATLMFVLSRTSELRAQRFIKIWGTLGEENKDEPK